MYKKGYVYKMEFNHDCARDELLWMEKNLTLNGMTPEKMFDEINYSKDVSIYCLDKLIEGDYVDGGLSIQRDFQGKANIQITPINEITFKGHDYLDSTRDDRTWDKAKKVAKKVGSVTLKQMGTIAADIIRKELGL